MLPRADMFKEVIFVPRLIVFNESFVPVSKYAKTAKPLAIIWHEGISGRNKEDLISTFYAFFLQNRDVHNITIWLDNCAAQNKNWALFCFFIYMVNCTEAELENLDLKYFQPGHTFMSSDSFHHQVELSLKKQGKVFDFNDFKCAVEKANSSRVNVKEMGIQNFFEWKDVSSKFKLQKIIPKPYLQNMVHVNFRRGENVLYYKNTFSDEFTLLNFLTAKFYKEGISKPDCKTDCRGISAERKSTLISKLRPIIPENRMNFWEELNITKSNMDLDINL